MVEIQNILFEPTADWKPSLKFPNLSSVKTIGLDLETKDPLLRDMGPGTFRRDGYPVGISLATNDFYAYYPFAHEMGGNLPKENVLSFFKDLLKRPELTIVGAHLPYDLEWLRFEGVHVAGTPRDVQLAEPLIDEESIQGYGLDKLTKKYLGKSKETKLLNEALSAFGFGSTTRKDIWKLHSKYVGLYAEADAYDALRVYEKQKKVLDDRDLWPIFNLETDLIKVLLEMRFHGVRVDLDKAAKLSVDLQKKEEVMLKALRQEVGFKINVRSSDDIVKVCKQGGYEIPRTLKGNPSFDKIFLETSQVPFFKRIREIRNLSHLRSTFIDDLVFKYEVRGRIHTTFKQMVADDGGTRTGRMASANPNLQQIPSRNKEVAPLIRSLFIPEEGEQWCKLDYSQQELRVLTHYAYILKLRGASEMRDLYINDKKTDFHMVTARISGLDRKPAKDLGFGICYGEGIDKMSRDMGVTRERAKQILTQFNEAIPFVRGLSDRVMEQADRVGYIKTIMGRHRHFDFWEPVDSYDMKNKGIQCLPCRFEEAQNRWPGLRLKRAFTYKGLNALIQGSSADMTKKAMVDIWQKHKKVPLLQVHDELDFSVRDENEGAVYQWNMENCVEVEVPMLAELKLKSTW